MDKISDIKTPKNKTIELLNGKKAVIGKISLDTMGWVEDEFGDWNKFGEILKGGKLKPIAGLLYQILENKEDFKDEKDFMRNFPLSNIFSIKDIILEQIELCMPTEQQQNQMKKTGEVENTDGKKNEAGQIISQP